MALPGLSALWIDQVSSGVAWLYLVTNGARAVSYLPRIIAIWRCSDGARAISLLTWGYWLMSHLTALLYGSLVIHDAFFTVISSLNLVCCGAVTTLAARRRGLLSFASTASIDSYKPRPERGRG